MNLIPLPAGQDDHLWLLHNGRQALEMDPDDAQPVPRYLQLDGLQLEAILVTPRHPNHIGGGEAHSGTGVEPCQRVRIAEPANPKLINYIQRKKLRELELDALTQG